MAKRKTRRERRTFTDVYKQQVLELVRVGDKSVSQICSDLDLTASTVRKWIKADHTSHGVITQNSLSETDQQELVRLRTRHHVVTCPSQERGLSLRWVPQSQSHN